MTPGARSNAGALRTIGSAPGFDIDVLPVVFTQR
jgi:hypothetical protein